MSEERTPLTACPTPETIAAYIDGRLDASESARVSTHLLDCEICEDVFTDAALAVADARSVPAPAGASSRPHGGHARLWLAVAAACLVAVVAWQLWPAGGRAEPEATLTALAGAGAIRPGIARLSVPFAWAALDETRGAAEALTPEAREYVARLERLAEGSTDPALSHARGVALLVQGQLDDAIASLDEAVTAEDTPARSFRLDLAAALVERSRQADNPFDAVRAVDQLEFLIADAPAMLEARFNLALALDYMGLTGDAIQAWRDYLALDATSAWATEARDHLVRLEGRTPTGGATDGGAGSTTAARSPLESYAALEDLLLEWDAGSPGAWRRDLALAEAASVRATGADLQLPDLVDIVDSAGGWGSARRNCLADGLRARADAVQLFDDTEYDRASVRAHNAVDAFACASVRVIDAEMQQEQIRYFSDRSREALTNLERIELVAEQSEYWRVVGRVRHVRGLDAYRRGQFSDAAVHYRTGLDAYGRAGDTDRGGSLEVLTAELLNEQGDRLRAWVHYRRALAALPTMTGFRRRHSVLVASATACQVAGLPAAAMRLAGALIGLGETLANPVATIAGNLHLARAASTLGDTTRADSAIASARRAQLQVPDEILRGQAEGDISWVEGLVWHERRPEEAIDSLSRGIDLYTTTNFSGRLAEFYLLRGRAHRALNDDPGARADFEAGLALFEDQREAIREEQLRISRTSQLWGLFQELMDLESGSAEEVLEIAERSRARALLDSLALNGQSRPLKDQDLYNWLPPNATAIVYASLPDRLLRLVVTHNGVRDAGSVAVSSRALARLVERHVKAIESGRISETAADIASIVLPADLPLKAGAPLILVPDGSLYALPFASLPGAVEGHFLVEDTIPVIAASLTTLRLGHERGERWTRDVLLIGAAEGRPDENLSPLDGVAGEINQLVRLYPGVRPLVGQAANRSAVLAALPDATLVHFAGHAVADPLRPSRSRLLMSDGPAGDLGPEDLAAVPLRAGTIVVLAACSTGRGFVEKGEGPMSLARPFLATGAGAVVASLWPIADEQSASVMVGLHEGIARGLPVSLALAEAQRRALETGVPARVWSAFQSIGGLK